MIQEKSCSYCHAIKEHTEFYKRKHGAYLFGVDHICKACYAIKRAMKKEQNARYRKQYYLLNKDKSFEQTKQWRINNPIQSKSISDNTRHKRRAYIKQGSVKTQELRELISNSKNCYYCNMELNGVYHIDHYIPLSKGGLHSIENIVISCPSCNLKKGNKDPLMFISSTTQRIEL